MSRWISLPMVALLAQIVPGPCALPEKADDSLIAGRALQEPAVDSAVALGSIAGHVLGMTQHGGQRPLEGALVLLLHDNRVIRETHTNEEGFYHMPEVRAGEYGMVARARGFLPEDARVEVIAGHETRQDFLLHPDQGEFGAVVGRVMGLVDGHQVPLEGALVALLRDGRVIRETHTNAEGFYGMPEVPVGEYGMVARARGFLPADARVEVIAGHETRQDFLLHPDQREFGAVVGRVMGLVDGHQVPLEGALVALLRDGGVIRETHTNAEGFYGLPEVPVGEYGMVARARGFLPADARVEVIAGHETRQDFLLHPDQREFGAVVGRVMGLVDGHQVPLEGALVALLRDGRVIRETHTNREGFYGMPEVPVGEYGMVARAEGFLPQDARIEVIAGHETRQDFLLHRSPPGPGAIVGRVMEPAGGGLRPLRGALVTLHAGPHVLRQALTNEEGFYEMAEVPPGVFALMAQAERHEPGVQRVVVISGEASRVGFLLRPVRDP